MERKVLTGISPTVHLDQVRSEKNTKLAYLQQAQSRQDESVPQKFPTQENWCYLLAGEIIKCWLAEKPEQLPSLDRLLGFVLNDSPNFLLDRLSQGEAKQYDLFAELQDRLNKSIYINSSDHNYLANLKRINQDIKNWYAGKMMSEGCTGCRLRLKQNARNLKTQAHGDYQKAVNALFGTVPPQSCLDYFEKAKIVLSRFIEQYQEAKEDCDRDKSKGIKSYRYLLQQIENSSDNFTVQDSYEGAKNLLLHIYRSTLTSDIQIHSIAIITYIIDTNQAYLDNVSKTCNFFSELESNLALKSNNSNLSPFLFEKFLEHSSPLILRQEIEKESGYSLYRWGGDFFYFPSGSTRFIAAKIKSYCRKNLQ